MASADWRLEGEWIKNCNCAFGCPCDFNARPTQGHCEGLAGMRIVKGHYKQTKLDGLCFAMTVHFPGALHEGNGEAQPIIDEKATPEQREALGAILSGENSAEGTLFHIFSLIVAKHHDPVVAPFEWTFDKQGRTARLFVPGVLETAVDQEPGHRRGSPHPGPHAGRFRAPRGGSGVRQDKQHRRDQVRNVRQP